MVDGEDDEVRDEVDEDALHRVLDVVRDLEFHRCRVLCEQSDEPEGQEETDDDDADGDSHSLQAFLEVLGGLSVQFFVHDRMTFPLEIQCKNAPGTQENEHDSQDPFKRLVTIDSDPDPDQAQYKVEIRGERLDPELFFSDAFVFHLGVDECGFLPQTY